MVINCDLKSGLLYTLVRRFRDRVLVLSIIQLASEILENKNFLMCLIFGRKDTQKTNNLTGKSFFLN